MNNIKYSVELNENGRPCIDLPEDYEQRPEDRFFALEIVRYMLNDLLERNNGKLDNSTIVAIDKAERLIGQLGDEVAKILYDGMRAQGELDIMLDKVFHIIVRNIKERDALPDKNIFQDGKIFDRIKGLKVAISSNDYRNLNDSSPIYNIYELVDGITNEHWVKL